MNDSKPGRFDWGDIKYFLAIVEHGSFVKAAEKTGITQPTISRRIDQLEGQIGRKLFTRTSSGALLTDAGKSLLQDAQRMAASADSIERLSASEEDKALGRVKLRIPDVLASAVVLPRLQQFLAQHPKLSLIIDCGIVALDDSSPDILVQFMDPNDQNLVRLPMCWVHYSYFGAASYLDAHGEPDTPAKLATHRLVHHTAYDYHRKRWNVKTDAIELLVEDELLVVCSGPLNLQAIQHGVGLGALPSVVHDTVPGLVPLNLPCAASLRLNMYHAAGADDHTAIDVCKKWLLSMFSPKSCRWFSEEFINPFDASDTPTDSNR